MIVEQFTVLNVLVLLATSKMLLRIWNQSMLRTTYSKIVKLKYIKEERGYWYFRKGGVRRGLRGSPGDPDFMEDYARTP